MLNDTVNLIFVGLLYLYKILYVQKLYIVFNYIGERNFEIENANAKRKSRLVLLHNY